MHTRVTRGTRVHLQTYQQAHMCLLPQVHICSNLEKHMLFKPRSTEIHTCLDLKKRTCTQSPRSSYTEWLLRPRAAQIHIHMQSHRGTHVYSEPQSCTCVLRAPNISTHRCGLTGAHLLRPIVSNLHMCSATQRCTCSMS